MAGANARFTEGPEGRAIARMAVPMTIGIMLVILFNVVDAFFIAQLSEAHLAAITFTFPVVLFIAQITMGLGTGVSSVIARAIGGNANCMEGDAQRHTFHALLLAISVIGTLCIALFFSIEPVFKLLGASDENIVIIKQYMPIWCVAELFVCIPMMGNYVLRAKGDGKTPALVMLVGALVNLVLDPLLIFGIGPFPRLEVQGAAIATLIAYMCGCAVGLYVLIVREKLLDKQFMQLQGMWQHWKRFLHVGLPSVATNMMLPLSQSALVAMVARYGDAAIAAFGAAGRLEALMIVPFMALGASIAPFMGQNIAANQHQRMQRGFFLCSRFCLQWGIGVLLLLWLLAPFLAAAFTDTAEAASIMQRYLRIAPFGYAGIGVAICFSSAMNGMGCPMRATALTLLRSIILLIPLSYLSMQIWGVLGIFFAIMGVHAAVGLMGYVWGRKLLRYSILY